MGFDKVSLRGHPPFGGLDQFGSLTLEQTRHTHNNTIVPRHSMYAIYASIRVVDWGSFWGGSPSWQSHGSWCLGDWQCMCYKNPRLSSDTRGPLDCAPPSHQRRNQRFVLRGVKPTTQGPRGAL